MSKSNNIFIVGAVLAALAVIWGLVSCNSGKQDITSRIHLLKEETVPLRFKLFSQQNSSMVLAGKFFDLDGNSVGRFETPYSNNGPISVHFTDVDVKGCHIIFPNSISFGDANYEIDICQYYEENGFPNVYKSMILDSVLRVEIGNIFTLLSNGKENKVEKQYGTVTFLSSDIEHPREGVNYEFHITTEGKIFNLKTN